MNKVPDRNTSSGSCSSQRKKAIRADALRNGVIAVFRFKYYFRQRGYTFWQTWTRDLWLAANFLERFYQRSILENLFCKGTR